MNPFGSPSDETLLLVPHMTMLLVGVLLYMYVIKDPLWDRAKSSKLDQDYEKNRLSMW